MGYVSRIRKNTEVTRRTFLLGLGAGAVAWRARARIPLGGSGGGSSGGLTFVPNGNITLTGSIADGATVTLGGSGLAAVAGSQGPTNLIAYKNMANETPGTQMSTTLDAGSGSIAAGGFGTSYVIANSMLPYGKGIVIGLEPTRMGSNSAYGLNKFLFGTTATEVFSLSSLWFPSTNDYTKLSGGGSGIAVAQFKHQWILNNTGTSNYTADILLESFLATNYSDQLNYQSNHAIPIPILVSPNQTPGTGPWKSSATGVNGGLSNIDTDQQLRIGTHIILNAAAGSGTGNVLNTTFTNSSHGTVLYSNPNTEMVPSGATPNGFVQINHPGFVQNSSGGSTEAQQEYNFDVNSYGIMGEIYICVGAGASARLELGDASTYAACKKTAVWTPSIGNWNPSGAGIQQTIRAGVFYQSMRNCYVYITNASDQTTLLGQLV